jgi:hypothetical protein
VQIRRLPADVWAFVVDHDNDPRWCKKVSPSSRPGNAGWLVTHKPVPLRSPMVLALEQLDARPPRLLKLGEEDAVSVFDVTYRLDADQCGTRFTQISEFEWKNLPRLLHRVFGRGVAATCNDSCKTSSASSRRSRAVIILRVPDPAQARCVAGTAGMPVAMADQVSTTRASPVYV